MTTLGEAKFILENAKPSKVNECVYTITISDYDDLAYNLCITNLLDAVSIKWWNNKFSATYVITTDFVNYLRKLVNPPNYGPIDPTRYTGMGMYLRDAR